MNVRRFARYSRNIAALGCLGLCLWCGWTALGSLRPPEEGAGAPVFVPELPSVSSGAPAEPVPEMELVFLEDGVVPFHSDQLPGVTATPQPDRPSAPVEEILLDGGAPVADFTVRDTSGSGADLLEELAAEPAVSLHGDGRVEILLYHTHTSEAYSPSYTGFYYTDMETRTSNQDLSVVAVGRELKAALEARGYGVVHDTTVCDEQFNGSYSRSWEVIQRNLEEYPDIQITIDIHRDSMTTAEGVKYKPTAQIEGRKAAQCMLLAGSDPYDEWGDFPNWEENLRLILRVQQKAAQLYPDLMRPLDFSDCKYNMNATSGSMLVEVGTEVSTVGEARYSGQLLGEILAEALDDLKTE